MTGEGRPRRPAKKAGKSPRRREPTPLTRASLEQLALSYVNRFDVSANKLQRYLSTRARKAGAGEEALGWISDLIERYLGSGVLDDARFARNLTSQLTARGKSTRAISQKLAARGVASELREELMSARRRDDPNAELEAARAYVRRRRLGPYRSAEEREAHRHKDLARLARQGFGFDVARQALGDGASSDDEF